MDFDGDDLEACQPLDFVHNAGSDGRGDLSKVQAVLDDNVQVDRETVVAALDDDSLRQPVTGEEAWEASTARHPDDAITLSGRGPNELSDRFG